MMCKNRSSILLKAASLAAMACSRSARAQTMERKEEAVDFWAEPANQSDQQEEATVVTQICNAEKHTFDPLVHKETYKIGVHAINGFEKAIVMYNLTFGEYLTATAGQRFDPPIRFEMIPKTMRGLYDDLETEELDFFLANPGIYSCVGVEYGAQPINTIVKRSTVRGHTYDLDLFGGVIFSLNDRDDGSHIHTVSDLKDKVIGAGSMDMIMAGQMQFYEMLKAGLSFVMDPKQVVFTENQDEVVRGVIDGKFDAGFVRTGQLEQSTDSNGDPVDTDLFEIVSPGIHLMNDGNLFPFLHSTDILAEWPVAALPHVDWNVAEEVHDALIALSIHAEVCEKNHLGGAFIPTRCDQTEEVTTLAWAASQAGKIARFRTPMSYFPVRTMQEEAGFLKRDARGDWKCFQAETLYDAINCPAGHYKLSLDEYENTCPDANLPCYGYDCYCKPCMKAHDVDVFECYHPDDHIHADRHIGCDKMELCGKIEQTKGIQFRARDNIKRMGSELSVKMHLGGGSEDVSVIKVDDYRYKFNWTSNYVGVGILEVAINGEQVSESPFRVEVVERDCDADYPGAHKHAAGNGDCVCDSSTVQIGGKCVDSTVLAVIFSVVFLIITLMAAVAFIRWKNHKNDQVWMVTVEELHFDDPPEVIGQGSFGLVLLAEYRGTKVAIKKAIKYGGRRGSVRGSTRSRSKIPRSSKPRSSSKGRNSASSSRDSSKDVAYSNSGSCELESDTTDSADPEAGNQIAEMGSDGLLNTGSLGRDSSLGWLRESNIQGNWLCPCWKKHVDFHTRFKDSVLGMSASVSKKSFVARICPWFNEQARKEEEFMAEMRILSRLRHPCITTVMGAVVSHSHEPMLVMEYMEQGSLHDLLRNDTMILSGEITLQICRDVAQGLRYLHSSKPAVLHGDLKARNIVIDSRFRAKLCDFGLSDKNHNLITGTPFWLAPEYLIGKTHYNSTCDIYSIGIILYEIYSRKTPYEGEHFREVIRKVCDGRVNKRPGIPDCTPPKMADLMKKCWHRDSFFRPDAQALDLALMDMSTTDAQPLEEEKDSRRTGYELFPKAMAAALKAGHKVEPESHEMVTVVFSEIVDFHGIVSNMSPLKVSHMLDRLYLLTDQLAKDHNIFKVETVGDNWMGVTNLENDQQDTHVKKIAEFAIDMVNNVASKILIDEDCPDLGYVRLRVGFHSGSVVGNVIGSLNPRFGLFGDSVNTASRMESNSSANRILCSEASYRLLKEQGPEVPVHKRGKIQVKGKGVMTVYWVGDKLVTAGKFSPSSKEGKRVDFESESHDCA